MQHLFIQQTDLSYNVSTVFQNVFVVILDIIEGNLKGIMRLVLALAAHFKPESFKYHTLHSATPGSSSKPKVLQRTPSVMSLASDAATSLLEASKNASSAGISLHYKYR